MLEPVPVQTTAGTPPVETPAAVPEGDEARAENAPVTDTEAPASAGVDALPAETASAETTRPEASRPVQRLRAIGRRVRYGRPGKHGPGLPGDGEPLDQWERDQLLVIDRGWKKAARPERSRT